MEFIRRHAFTIICSVVALAGLAIGVTGLQAMPKVADKMHEAKRVFDELGSLENGAANRQVIGAEKRRIDSIVQDRNRVIQRCLTLYPYKPLIDGVFPNGDDNRRRQFKSTYQTAMQALHDSMRSGATAMSQDVENMRDKIEAEKDRAKEQNLDPGAVPLSPVETGPAETPAGFLTVAGAKENPAARAEMATAQQFYMYATPFEIRKNTKVRALSKATPSLDFHPAMMDTGTVDAPYPDECWEAQVGYWIQKDVVEAINDVNIQAAAKLKKAGVARWVGTLPIKELISVRVSADYVPPFGEGELVNGAQPGGRQEALPPISAENVFTHNGRSGTFEVVQFTVKMVMDQRDISVFVNRLTAGRFHTLLRVAYKQVLPNKRMVGKIYGADPVVNVVMDFESVMLGEIFRKWMPPEVCDRYEIACPEPEEGTDEEGDT